MESIEFINKYESYIDDISLVIKPELQPILDELRHIDTHNLVSSVFLLTMKVFCVLQKIKSVFNMPFSLLILLI